MDHAKKFENKLYCICDENVLFEIIDEIECDWGVHSVAQCPKCEELFSTDCKCPAFGDVMQIAEKNNSLYSEKEKSQYLTNSHPK